MFMRQKLEQVQGWSRVAGVLRHEIRESAAPPCSGLGTGHRAAAMPLQLADDLAPGELSVLVAAAMLSLILQRALLSHSNQIAGTGAHQKLGHRPGRWMQPAQPSSFSGRGKVRCQAGGQHRADLAESQWTGNVEEEAHGGQLPVASRESSVHSLQL